jgi:hypothetical protein
MNKHYLKLLLIFFAVGCYDNNQSVDKGYYFENFDNLNAWTSNQQVTKVQGHSGQYSTFTDSLHQYSQTFALNLSDIKAKKFKKIDITAWIFRPSIETKASVVASIDGEGMKSLYSSIDLTDAVPDAGKWTKTFFSVNLPDVIADNAKLKVYLWAPSFQKSYMDDVEINFH